MISEAIILAGGFGTRLQSIVKEVPKPMASVNNKPFLEYILTYAAQNQIKRCILSVGYLSDVIINHFGNQFLGMEIDYAIEEKPLGTGGALYYAMKMCSTETVLVLNGDSRFDAGLPGAFEFHKSKKADVTICLKPMVNTSRYGTVEINTDSRLEAFKEKQHDVSGSGLINTGVYLFNPSVWKKVTMPSGNFSLEKDFFEPFIHDLSIYGYVQDSYFIDIGIPEDYARAQHEFK